MGKDKKEKDPKEQKKKKSKAIGSKKIPKDAGYCSWCKKLCGHEVVEENLLRRNVYKCKQCGKRTLMCRQIGCHDYARGLPDWDEEFCAVHGNVITSWEEAEELEDGAGKARCSWCLQLTNHSIFQKNTFARDRFQCDGCKNITAKCRTCDSMAKCHDKWVDELCCKCDGSITDWDAPAPFEEGKSMRIAWCQKCFEKGEHFILQKNVLSSDVFQCSLCHAKNNACKSCKDGSVLVEEERGEGEEERECLSCAGFTGGEGGEGGGGGGGDKEKEEKEKKKKKPQSMEDIEKSLKERIILMADSQNYMPGELVLAEGNTSRRLYLIGHGELQVTKVIAGEAKDLATLTAPETFGEITFLQGGQATASIRAKTPSEIFVVDREKIEGNRYLSGDEHSEWFYKYLAVKLALRLRKTSEQQTKGFSKSAKGGPPPKKVETVNDVAKLAEKIGLSPTTQPLFQNICTCQPRGSGEKKGNIYIFSTHIVFVSKMFGSVTTYIIPFSGLEEVIQPGGRCFILVSGGQRLTITMATMDNFSRAISAILGKFVPGATGGVGSSATSDGEDHLMEEILGGAEAISFKPGQTLIREGEEVQGLYQITDGGVDIVKRSQVLAALGTGEIFGELSFLGGGGASASVVAGSGGADALKLDGSVVRRKIEEKPALGGRFYRMVACIVADRLKNTVK